MTKQLKTKGKVRQRSLFVDERSLCEKLYDQSNLEAGFKAVKKNRGVPGIDGVTIKEFESRLEEELVSTSSMDKSCMRSRVRTRTHGSVGRRELRLPLTRSRMY